MIILLSMALALQDNGTGGPGVRWKNIDQASGFPAWRRLVREHVKSEGKHRINRLCAVVGIDPATGPEDTDLVTAYIYWPEERLIERLSNTDDTAMSEMLFGRGPIDLRKDVIRPGVSTNLDPNAVTRGWVDRLIGRCRTMGTRLTVIRRP